MKILKHKFFSWEDQSMVEMVRRNYNFVPRSKMLQKYFSTKEIRYVDDFVEIQVGEQ